MSMEIVFTLVDGSEIASEWSEAATKYDKRMSALAGRLTKEVLSIVKQGITGTVGGTLRAGGKEGPSMINFNFAPLTPKYAARKAREGLDPRILIATKEYIRKLKAVEVSEGKWEIQGDLDLAFLLENGTKRMRSRRHWGPALEMVFEKYGANPREILDMVLRGDKSTPTGGSSAVP